MTMPAELWTAWRTRRDARAFAALVGPELGHALGFARRLGSTAADAEDALQEALARLATATDDAPPEHGVRAWLCREVRNRVRSVRRSEGRLHAREAAYARPEGVAPGLPALDVREEVERALASLDADDREAVMLRFLHDLDYADVAAVLGISEGASRSRVHRAVRLLRERLGRDGAAALAVVPGAVALDTGRVVGAALARSGAAKGVVVMSTSKKLAAATLLTAVVAAGAAVVVAWSGLLGARGVGVWEGGGRVAGGTAGNDSDDADGTPGNERRGSAPRPGVRAMRPVAGAEETAATPGPADGAPRAASDPLPVATVPAAAAEGRERKADVARFKYRTKQERANVLCYHDLSYGVDRGSKDRPMIDSRWSRNAEGWDAKETGGIQFSLSFSDAKLPEGSGIAFRVQKFLHKQGTNEFIVPFARAGTSPKTADKKGMIEGFFAEYSATLADLVKDRCAPPRKVKVGPAEFFASVVGTPPDTGKRQRMDFYLWQQPNCTYVCVVTYTGVCQEKSDAFAEKVEEVLRAHMELKAPD